MAGRQATAGEQARRVKHGGRPDRGGHDGRSGTGRGADQGGRKDQGGHAEQAEQARQGGHPDHAEHRGQAEHGGHGRQPGPIGREEFGRTVDPYRRELLAHCYRMLGSVHDAEDLVQETYLRAWRFYGGFEGRSSIRRWLYRIATNACLRALERRARSPLPSGLGGPGDRPDRALTARPDVPWLEPVPDALVGLDPADAARRPYAADPAAVAAARGTLRLAFVAVLQLLPARQRAVLILRDVLAFSAGETAEALETTTAAVNSALQRARAHLARVSPAEDEVAEPTEPDLRALLDRYVAAFENSDLDGLMNVLRDDAVLEMPPYATWFAGASTIARFFESQVFAGPGTARLTMTRANGQLAVAAYVRGPDGDWHGHALHVVTADAGTRRVARMVVFLDETLFPVFGLPLRLPADDDAGGNWPPAGR